MSEKLRMDAYYYAFSSTKSPEIDLILSAVACAGKAYHNTEGWNEDCEPYECHEGKTPVEWINNAADKAAAALTAATKRAERLEIALRSIRHYILKEGETDTDLAMRHIAHEALKENE